MSKDLTLNRRDALSDLTHQPGVKHVYYGTQLENPNTLTLFVDWTSRDEQVKFTNSSSYSQYVERIKSLTTDNALPFSRYISFTPSSPSVSLSNAASSVTEVIITFYDATITPAEKEDMRGRLAKWMNLVSPEPGFRDWTSGWQIEQSGPTSESADKTPVVFVNLVGWESLEHHENFFKTDVFSQNIHLLKEAPKVIDGRIFHLFSREVKG